MTQLIHTTVGRTFANEELARRDYAERTWKETGTCTSFDPDDPELLAKLLAVGYAEYIPPPPYVPTMAERQAQVWEQIKAHREQRRAGGVYVQNHWYHSDSDSKLQFVELRTNADKVLAAGGTAETILQANIPGVGLVDITWKPVESFVRVSMTAGLALAIVEAITVAEMINFNTADTHRLAMIAASNLLTSDPGYIAPEVYDYSTGWTGSYSA